jgi:hypothetical protein
LGLYGKLYEVSALDTVLEVIVVRIVEDGSWLTTEEFRKCIEEYMPEIPRRSGAIQTRETAASTFNTVSYSSQLKLLWQAT